MKRILFQTVGTGGSDNPVWEALAHTVRTRQPDVLVQICSQASRRETLPKFKEALGTSHHPQMATREFTTDDHDNVESIASECRAAIDRVRGEFPDAVIECDFTSGTKAMSAALVVAAVERGCTSLHYAVGPRDASGRATSTERVVTLKPLRSRADRELRALGGLFGLGQFAAVEQQATSLASELEPGDRLHDRAVSLAFLADAYAKWDRFDWKQARAKLREHAKDKHRVAKAGWDTDALTRQVGFLNSAEEQNEGKPPSGERLADLLANAARCTARGRYDDAVARLYRLVEYIAQARLLDRGINPGRWWTADQLAKHAPTAAAGLETQHGTKRFKIDLAKAIRVLTEIAEPIGLELHERYGDPPNGWHTELSNLLQKRNNSYLAHGTNPIEAETAHDLYQQVAAVLELHLGDADHALGAERLRELTETAVFIRCPWAS